MKNELLDRGTLPWPTSAERTPDRLPPDPKRGMDVAISLEGDLDGSRTVVLERMPPEGADMTPDEPAEDGGRLITRGDDGALERGEIPDAELRGVRLETGDRLNDGAERTLDGEKVRGDDEIRGEDDIRGEDEILGEADERICPPEDRVELRTVGAELRAPCASSVSATAVIARLPTIQPMNFIHDWCNMRKLLGYSFASEGGDLPRPNNRMGRGRRLQGSPDRTRQNAYAKVRGNP